MVEEGLIIEQPKDEFQQIMEHIANGDNFLLSGGAGSGKTYSLVQVIRQVIADNPVSKVACMTYTNAAVKEIEERVDHKNLNVSTIHDFLWDNIKHFQKELKLAIVALVNDSSQSKIKINDQNTIPDDYFDNRVEPIDKIQYREYLRLKEGIISHDELLIIAAYMFEKYPKLCDVVKDKYKFIFIDEYQDTSALVVDVFLKSFKKSKKSNIIGFFGDAMQSIYDDGIGNLDVYKGDEAGKVKEVKKIQNRRNPQKVIDLANMLRTDGLTQVASNDLKAPNMMVAGGVKEGEILFLHSTNADISRVKQFLSDKYHWDFYNAKETKELNLTHNLIADKAGFRTLMDIYDKDPIIGLKKDILKKIKDNKEQGRPEIAIGEKDTFDNVVDNFQLKNQQRQLKKDILLSDNQSLGLYNQLKDKLFSEVQRIYLDKDQLIDDKKQAPDEENKKGSKRDNLIRHLHKIETIIDLYKNKEYNEFLKKTESKISTAADKKALKEKIDTLIEVGDKTIEEVITDAHEKGICLKDDDKLENFIKENGYVYNRVKAVKYKEFQELFKYLEGKTPFSTQHKTKGTEFGNVLVILDNGRWSDYNFKYLFDFNNQTFNGLDKKKKESHPKILNRTQKIFYVCCTRAKEKLSVFYHDPSPIVLGKAIEWFGEGSVKDLDE